MNCANLLAFIQVAVAFNFGLVFFKDSNVMKDIHVSFMTEMSVKHRKVLKEATDLLEKDIEGETENQRDYRYDLEDALNGLLMKTNPNQGNWGKYAYLGLFGGIYGLICLLAIGMFDLFSETFTGILQTFLLISAEVILAIGILSICQLHFMEEKSTSTTKILKKTAVIMLILAVVFGFSCLDWTYGFFDSFELPFLWFTVIIVTLPILVFAVKIILVAYGIKQASKKCQEAAKQYEHVITT